MNRLINKLTWVTIFSIAMGFMETAVVVYLRKIYYPEGFQFPLVPMDADLALTEILREAATIVMLLGIGFLSGKNTSQKFAYFIYSFAIWDIFYYVFLKVLLDWPESLLTWDILFLIPVPWVGPVIAPCIVSVTMIVLTSSIIYFQEKGFNTKIQPTEWFLLGFGSIVVIVSFIWDFTNYIYQGNSSAAILSSSGTDVEIRNYIPSVFNWWLFAIGQLTIISGIVIFIKRIKKENPKIKIEY